MKYTRYTELFRSKIQHVSLSVVCLAIIGWLALGYGLLQPTPSLAAEPCEQYQCDADSEDTNAYLSCVSDKKICLEAELDKVQDQKVTLANTISLINGKISIQELAINQRQAEINTLEKEIGGLTERISGLNLSLDRLSSMLVDRVQIQYKRSRISPLILFVGSDNFNQFVSQYKYLARAGEQTAQAMSRAETQRIEYDEQKSLKEQKQVEVEAKRRELESERQTLARQRTEQQYLLTETQHNESRYQAELAKTLAELQAIQSIIAGQGDESKVGDVEEGDKIASIIVGASTCSTGTHLHLEVVKNGVNFDPAAFLKSVDATWNNSPDGSFGFGGDWNWPVNNPAKINQGYGMTYYARVKRSYGGAPHTGIDMASKSQDYTVKAVKAGTVYRGSISCGGGLLRYVKLEHADSDYETYYLHVNY